MHSLVNIYIIGPCLLRNKDELDAIKYNSKQKHFMLSANFYNLIIIKVLFNWCVEKNA